MADLSGREVTGRSAACGISGIAHLAVREVTTIFILPGQ
jgi:hypothetical protein